ncbi:hypothetical protein SDJN02_04573, partial [Cucurbita argyrosperma subsp. argyrosperma]
MMNLLDFSFIVITDLTAFTSSLCSFLNFVAKSFHSQLEKLCSPPIVQESDSSIVNF